MKNKLEFLWEGQNYVMHGTTAGHDTQMFSVLNHEVEVVDPTWYLCLEHIYTCTVNLEAKQRMHWVNYRILFKSHINFTHQLENSLQKVNGQCASDIISYAARAS